MPNNSLMESNVLIEDVNQRFMQPAKSPLSAIELASYKGQDPMRKMYQGGYQGYLASMPVLLADDPLLKDKVKQSLDILQKLGSEIVRDPWIHWLEPRDGEANRTIIAIEDPETGGTAAIVVNRFGNGFQVPMHGHAAGLFYDQIVVGKMKENHYRLMPNNRARIVVTTIANAGDSEGDFGGIVGESRYTNHLHSLQAIGTAISLHYVSEFPRDGRSNGFEIEHFHQWYDLTPEKVERIDTHQAMYLQKGDVVLVRSENVPEYGDHYIVVTGPIVEKPHGFRVQEFCLDAPNAPLLDKLTPHHGTILLKFKPEARKAFHEFHGIQTSATGEVTHL